MKSCFPFPSNRSKERTVAVDSGDGVSLGETVGVVGGVKSSTTSSGTSALIHTGLHDGGGNGQTVHVRADVVDGLVDGKVHETETLRTVSGVLQRQFSQALTLVWTEDTEKTLAFSGDREQLRFIGPAPQHHGSTGLFEYTLAVEADADSARLVLYFQLHDPDINGFQPQLGDRQRVPLVDELKSAGFAYYGSPVADDPPQWYSQWSSDAEAFPQLVQARIDTGRGPWPELMLTLPTVPAK